MNTKLLYAIIGLVIAGVILTLMQVWGFAIAWDFYIKSIITIGILVLLFAFLLVVKSDLGEHKKLKDDNYLD